MSDQLSLRSSASLASSHVATLQSGTCHVAWRHATTDSRCSCPLLQGLHIEISLLISPVRMIAVKVSNQDCRMRKDWLQICVVPESSWWFVDVGNVISADTNDITARRRRHTRSIRDVAANICRTSMFGMESLECVGLADDET